MILTLTNQAVFVTLSVVKLRPLAPSHLFLTLNHADVIGDQSDHQSQNAWFRCALCAAISGEISILLQTGAESWGRFCVPRICRWESNMLSEHLFLLNDCLCVLAFSLSLLSVIFLFCIHYVNKFDCSFTECFTDNSFLYMHLFNPCKQFAAIVISILKALQIKLQIELPEANRCNMCKNLPIILNLGPIVYQCTNSFKSRAIGYH